MTRRITDPGYVPVKHHFGSYTCEIDLKTGTSLTPPSLVIYSPTGTAEGCHIFKKDGWYYLFSAEGGTFDGHMETVQRSRSPTGPYEKPPKGVNPILFNDKHPHVVNTGHLDLVEGEGGRWWSVFLAVRPQIAVSTEGASDAQPSQLGRETFLAPAEWVDGWPVINGGKKIELVGEAEGLTVLEEEESWSEEFEGEGECKD